MRTIPLAVLALLALAVAAAPSAVAVNAVKATDIFLTDVDGTRLRLIPRDDIVRLQILVNNTGTTAANETLTLHITIRNEATSTTVYDQTIRRGVNLAPGASTVIEQTWPPAGRDLGNHSIVVDIEESTAASYGAFFTVAETAVEAGTFGEKAARYSWFIGTFALVVILFAVVLASRRA